MDAFTFILMAIVALVAVTGLGVCLLLVALAWAVDWAFETLTRD